MRYGIKMRVMSLVMVLSMLFTVTYANAADWVGDWVSSYTYTGPNSFHGTNRTYMNGGSFHARWGDTGVEPIFTMQPPKIKAGCGGIDAFMGSFAFLDFGRLVQKFKKMATGAVAAFAFDIAMNVLCTPCSNAIKALEAISDAANALQVGDCMSAKDMMVSLKSADDKLGIAGDKLETLSNFNSDQDGSDYKDTWDKIKQSGYKTLGVNPDGTWGSMTQDCNATLKSYFQTEGSILSLFVVDNSTTILGGNSDEGANLLRAYVGDLYTKTDNTGSPKLWSQESCQLFDLDKFVEGDYRIQKSDIKNACEAGDPTGNFKGTAYTGGLVGLVDTMLKKSVSQLKLVNSPITTDVAAFLGQVPSIPLSFIIWHSWTESGATQASVESRVMAYEHDIAEIIGSAALLTLIHTADKTSHLGLNTIDTAMRAKSGTSTGSATSTVANAALAQVGNDSDKCRTEMFKDQITQLRGWLEGSGTAPGVFAKLDTHASNLATTKRTIEKQNDFSGFSRQWADLKVQFKDKLSGSVYERLSRTSGG